MSQPPPGAGDAPKRQRHELDPHAEWATFVAQKRTFSPEECAQITALGGATDAATLGSGETDPALRDSRISWIGRNAQTHWLYERLHGRLEAANARFLHLRVTGFTEPLQLGEYRPGQHYNWHTDFGPGRFRTRKLSFVVQLSDPADYDGGVLQIATDSRPKSMLRDQGALIAFPAYVMHRVTPVTRGLRRSLVGWLGGPPFA